MSNSLTSVDLQFRLDQWIDETISEILKDEQFGNHLGSTTDWDQPDVDVGCGVVHILDDESSGENSDIVSRLRALSKEGRHIDYRLQCQSDTSIATTVICIDGNPTHVTLLHGDPCVPLIQVNAVPRVEPQHWANALEFFRLQAEFDKRCKACAV